MSITSRLTRIEGRHFIPAPIVEHMLTRLGDLVLGWAPPPGDVLAHIHAAHKRLATLGEKITLCEFRALTFPIIDALRETATLENKLHVERVLRESLG